MPFEYISIRNYCAKNELKKKIKYLDWNDVEKFNWSEILFP